MFSKRTAGILTIILALTAIGIGAYEFYSRYNKSEPPGVGDLELKKPSSPENLDVSSWQTYPSTSSGQAAVDTSDWKVYHNEKYGFRVEYPNDWFIKFEEPNIEFTNNKQYVHGLGIPPRGDSSVSIIPKIESRNLGCEATSDYSTYAEWPGLLPMEKVICNNDFKIILEYTDYYEDPLTEAEINERRELLDRILSTFRFVE